jgi:LCP family protein required for cell wall assembly
VPDGPEEQDALDPTPDPTKGLADPAEPADQPAAPADFDPLEKFPAPDPKIRVMDKDDLSWVDKAPLTDEQIEHRRERRDNHKKRVRRTRRTRTLLKVSAVVLALLLILGGFWFYYAFSNLQRMPAVAGQGGKNFPGTNFLLIGDNPEEPDATQVTGIGYQHAFRASDMVMVLHVTRDGGAMYVVSIPQQSLLPIPATSSTPAKPGTLRDAYAAGGTKLYVKTIESYTGLTMDHVAVLNMDALREITDNLDGVFVQVPNPECNVQAGPHKFDGVGLLRYVALFPCMTGGDIDRVQHQQAALRALMKQAVDGGGITNPFTLTSLLHATSSNLTLEDGFGYLSILGTLYAMSDLRSSTTTFLTAPLALPQPPSQPGTITLDATKNQDLWLAMQEDRMQDYLALHTDVVTQ